MSEMKSQQRQNPSSKADNEWAGSDDESSCNEYIVQEITVIGDKPTKLWGSTETVNERLLVIDKGDSLSKFIERVTKPLSDINTLQRVKSDESIGQSEASKKSAARKPSDIKTSTVDETKSEDKSKEAGSSKPDTNKPLFDEARKTIDRIKDSAMDAAKSWFGSTEKTEDAKKSIEPSKDTADKTSDHKPKVGEKPTTTMGIPFTPTSGDKPKIEQLPVFAVIESAIKAEAGKTKTDVKSKEASGTKLETPLKPTSTPGVDKTKTEEKSPGATKPDTSKPPTGEAKKTVEQGKADNVNEHKPKADEKPTTTLGIPFAPSSEGKPKIEQLPYGVPPKPDASKPLIEEVKKTGKGAADSSSDQKPKVGEKPTTVLGIPYTPNPEDESKSHPFYFGVPLQAAVGLEKKKDEPKDAAPAHDSKSDTTKQPLISTKPAPSTAETKPEEKSLAAAASKVEPSKPKTEDAKKTIEPSKDTADRTSDHKPKVGEKPTTTMGIPFTPTAGEKPKVEQLPIGAVTKPMIPAPTTAVDTSKSGEKSKESDAVKRDTSKPQTDETKKTIEPIKDSAAKSTADKPKHDDKPSTSMKTSATQTREDKQTAETSKSTVGSSVAKTPTEKPSSGGGAGGQTSVEDEEDEDILTLVQQIMFKVDKLFSKNF